MKITMITSILVLFTCSIVLSQTVQPIRVSIVCFAHHSHEISYGLMPRQLRFPLLSKLWPLAVINKQKLNSYYKRTLKWKK
jgi:hypothetical protein